MEQDVLKSNKNNRLSALNAWIPNDLMGQTGYNLYPMTKLLIHKTQIRRANLDQTPPLQSTFVQLNDNDQNDLRCCCRTKPTSILHA